MMRSDSGQTMVELAFVLPILALVICGIVEMASLYKARYATSYATFIAARCAAVHSADADRIAANAARLIMVASAGLSGAATTSKATVSGRTVRVKLTYRRLISDPLVVHALNPVAWAAAHATGIHARTIVGLSGDLTFPILELKRGGASTPSGVGPAAGGAADAQ